jgi:hypothetical protein
MSRKNQPELDLGLDPIPEPAVPAKPLDLSIKAVSADVLSPAQIEFNKRLKSLERARAAHENKRRSLDKDLATCRDVLMPMVEDLNRVNYQVLLSMQERARKLKLSKRRREALDDLIMEKIDELYCDPAGLSDEEIDKLAALARNVVGPVAEDQEPTADEKEMIREEFDQLRALLEEAARMQGVELDLDGLDPHGDPDEFLEEMERRLAAASGGFHDDATGTPPSRKRKRKPTKAALEKERLKQEVEDAKKRDFKSLYKQLAKVLHPDLETDPELKSHKESWMKRLTAAHADGDLREMLAIEMEWLGEESGNLAKATDEKLRIYAMVLKEQLAELKQRTLYLFREPQYTPLQRFFQGFDDRLRAPAIRRELQSETENLRRLLATLEKGGVAARKLINESADRHANSYGF